MSETTTAEKSPSTRSRGEPETTNLLGATYARLKQDIILGVLPPEAALVEQSLAERYSVSRTPVREALRRLEQDGLIERTERTMRVRLHSPGEIFEHYEVRIILESAAARVAAAHRTDFDIANLTGLLASSDRAATIEERIQLDRSFHAAFWAASHNTTLCQTIERLYATSVRYLKTTLSDDDRWRHSREEHRQIVAAIVTGDSELADQLVAKHVRSGRDIHINEMIAVSPPPSP